MVNLNETISTFVIIELIDVTSAKTSISPVDFHPRLAVSKWIVPRSFLMGGVLGYNIVDCNNMIVIAFILAVYKYYYEA